MTYQSITNSTISGQIRISGMSDKATIAGGVVGLLMASLVDVNGKLTLLQVTTSGSSVTNYVGGIVGTGNGTTFLSNRIDSCTVEIANFVSDFTVDYVGGILASSSNLQVTRTIIKITNLSSCLHTGGLVGLATLSDLRQCMVVVETHNRSACRTPCWQSQLNAKESSLVVQWQWVLEILLFINHLLTLRLLLETIWKASFSVDFSVKVASFSSTALRLHMHTSILLPLRRLIQRSPSAAWLDIFG